MARRHHPRYSNQKHKHLKRPRSWHRSCLKTIDQIAEELGVENQRKREALEQWLPAQEKNLKD
jgi:hypothetical protein